MPSPSYSEIFKDIMFNNQYRWLVTGAAGFIGSNLVEALLSMNQKVIGLDNFSTGYERNIKNALKNTDRALDNFIFLEGDIRNLKICHQACKGIDYVLHHAALGSVPRSIEEPFEANTNNVNGFLNMLAAAKDSGVQRFVYASSSAVYGNDPHPLKSEEAVGNPLSPYAATKVINEIYADTWYQVYGLESVGLRYFNVFGVRQDPNGAYAAVIPKWIEAMQKGLPIKIFGDGKTTRDFCYIKDVVHANILAALNAQKGAAGRAFNIACGEKTTLNQLFDTLKALIDPASSITPVYEDFRKGDIPHSMASIAQAKKFLG